MAKSTAIVILNLGTPKAPTPQFVGEYLSEFLMDEKVIGAPRPLRDFLVKGLIVPRRKHLSAANYKKIWTAEGSPLLVNTDRFAKALGLKLSLPIYVAMRYQEPSFLKALQSAKNAGIDRLVVWPQFPQNAASTSGSSLEHFSKVLGSMSWQPEVVMVPQFYQEPFFIHSLACVYNDSLAQFTEAETNNLHVLATFHGLPNSHILSSSPKCAKCLATSCEPRTDEECYRGQCFATARSFAKAAGIPYDRLHVSFQSRLGPMKWTQPSTHGLLRDLAHRGVQKVAVLCPSFTVDCLETLEEIFQGEREHFLRQGGLFFLPVPCLNDHPVWVESAAQFLTALMNSKESHMYIHQNDPKK